MNMNMNDIQGSGGGKGGGGQTFREDENTLRANVIVSSIEAWGEGPVVGPVLGAKSIFLDNTPLQNSDGTFNYGGKVGFAVRTGLPDQNEVPGFEFTGDPITVNTEIVFDTPVVRSVTDAAVSSIGLTISLPQGIYNQDTSNNALTATAIQLAVDVKLSASGTWVQQRLISYNDKTTSPYQETFRIDRPTGSGLWDVRVRRLTADNSSSTLRNNTFWAYHTELQLLGVTYPDIAYMAITVDAASVNSSQIPTRSAEIYGLIVQVPVNYNEQLRTYTGVWDGTFKNAWTNDPAWVLYAVCTNTRWGLGLDASQVDKYSFYEASVYNSQVVSFTNRAGTTTSAPRFSFNYQINQGQVAPEMLNQIASVMNAKVMWVGGQIVVLQDRPAPVSHLFTRANMIGLPVYKGSALQQRNTVANVTWNDPETQYQQRVVSVEDSEYLASYGYNPVNVAAYGCTNEPQAIRFGKWYLYTVLRTGEMITFTTGLEGQLVVPHEVIEVYDADYTGQAASGRLKVGSTTTMIMLDRTVNLSADAKIDIAYPDGTIVLDQNIVNVGNHSIITLNTALAVAPPEYAHYIIKTNSVSPRQFRVSKVTVLDKGQHRIEAMQYDSGKYSFVETGVALPTPVFTAIRPNVANPPTSLVLTERVIYLDNKINRTITASWTAPTNSLVARYQVSYRINGGELKIVSSPTTFFEIPDVVPGLTEVRVTAVSYRDVLSVPLVGRLTVEATEDTGSTLVSPTGLQVVGGGTDFSGRALSFEWTNPAANGTGDKGVADFKVEIYTTADVLLRTEYVAQVAPGNVQSFTYDYDKNLVDGGPRRSVKVKVYARDGNRKLSGAANATFSNPVPPALVGFNATGGIGNILLSWSKPVDTDLVGILVWRGSTSDFTPTAGNLIGETTGTSLLDGGLTAATSYFYKAAGYDAFSRPTDGAGLNVTLATGDTLTLADAGIPSGATTPADGSGVEGDLFFNTTDGKLYRYHAGVWTTAVPTVDLTGVIVSAQIGTAEVKTSNIDTSAITDIKLGTGSVTELKLGTAAVTTGKIADLAVTNSKIAVGAIQAQQLSVAIGGGNLLGNSRFTAREDILVPGVGVTTTPQGWRVYNPGSVANSTASFGAFFVQANATGSGLGIRTDYTYDAPYGGVGSLLARDSSSLTEPSSANREIDRSRVYGPKFVLSIDASKVNGGSITNLQLTLFGSGWSGATVTAINNPNLTGSDQRYSWLINAGSPVLGSNIDGFAISANGTWVSGDQVYFTKALLNEGDITGAWQPRVEELVPGTITAEHLQAESVTTSKLTASSVTADKIAANSITAGKIAANAVTASAIAVTDLTNYLMNGAFSTGLPDTSSTLAATNWVTTNTAEITNTGVPGGSPTLFALKLPNASGFLTPQAAANQNVLPAAGAVLVDVSPDQPLWYSARVIKSGTVNTGAVSLEVDFRDSSGSNLSFQNTTLEATTSWSTITGEITVPAGASLAAFTIRRLNDSGSGDWWGTSFEIRKKNAGKLIVDGAIVTNLLAANSITAAKIQAGAIETDKLAANSITSDKIVANAITAGKILAGAIEADKLAVNSVTADKIVANTITAAQIQDATITNAKIVDATLTGAKLADASITNAKIGGALTSDTFNGTITSGIITANGTTGWAFGKDGKLVLEATVFRNNKAAAAQARGYIYSAAGAVNTVSGGRAFAALTVPNDAVASTGANGHLTVYVRSASARRLEYAYWIRAVQGGTTIDMPAVVASHHLEGGEQWTATSPTTYVYRIPMSANWLYSGSYYTSTGTLRPGTAGILPVPSLFDNLLLAGTWYFSLETSMTLYDMSSALASEIDYVTMAAAGYALEHRGVQAFVPTSPFI